MSTPTLPFSANTSEAFSNLFNQEDPENIFFEDLALSVKSSSNTYGNFPTGCTEEQFYDEIEAEWRTNLFIDGEDQRRLLRIETFSKKTSLDIRFQEQSLNQSSAQSDA